MTRREPIHGGSPSAVLAADGHARELGVLCLNFCAAAGKPDSGGGEGRFAAPRFLNEATHPHRVKAAPALASLSLAEAGPVGAGLSARGGTDLRPSARGGPCRPSPARAGFCSCKTGPGAIHGGRKAGAELTGTYSWRVCKARPGQTAQCGVPVRGQARSHKVGGMPAPTRSGADQLPRRYRNFTTQLSTI